MSGYRPGHSPRKAVFGLSLLDHEALEQQKKMQISYIMNTSTWASRESLKPIFYMSERDHRRRKALKIPFTLRFKGNTTDISFLFQLGRFICNKKRKRIFFGRGADFSFRLHTNLNWFPLPLALISKKSIQFRGLWPLEHPLDGVPEGVPVLSHCSGSGG